MEFFDPTFDPTIKEDAYTYNRMTNEERDEYNKKYDKYMLSQANSSEEIIVQILKDNLNGFKEIRSKLSKTIDFRKKELNKRYADLQKERKKHVAYSVYVALENGILTQYLKEDHRTAKTKMANGSRGNETWLREWVEREVDGLCKLAERTKLEQQHQNGDPMIEMTIGENYPVDVNVFDFVEYGKSILIERKKNPIKNMRREKAQKLLDWTVEKDAENEQKLNSLDKEISKTAKEILKLDHKTEKELIEEINHELYVYTEKMSLNSGLSNKLKAYLEYGEKTPFKEKVERSLNSGKNSEYRKIRGYYQLHSPLVVKHLMDDLSDGKVKLPEKAQEPEME